MKKIIVLIACCILVFGGSYIFSKTNPPLTAEALSSTNDRQIVLVMVGNKGLLGAIDINEVLINEGAKPNNVKMQISHPSKGFIILERIEEELKEPSFTFKDLNEVTIPTGTSPQALRKKVDKGTITEEDRTYALTIRNEQTIETVTIKYRHLGISHKITVSTKGVKLS